MITTDLLTKARKINNFLLDATTTWDGTSTHSFVCPVGYRWILLGGCQNRAVSGTLLVSIYDTSDKLIQLLAEFAAGTGIDGWPQGQQIYGTPLMVLDAGEYVKYSFGAVQNASSYISCVVLEVKV